MNRTINLSVLNYLVQKLEHRARCVNKTKTKCTEHENALIKEFAAFLGEIEEDLKQAASVIMNLINENKKYENICLNKTIKETNDNINRTLSELKKSTRSNKTDEEKEKSKLHLQLYDKQHMIKMKNNSNTKTNRVNISKSESPEKKGSGISNAKGIIYDMKQNKMQLKKEIKKHLSNSNIGIENDDIAKSVTNTDWNKEDNNKVPMRFREKYKNKKKLQLTENGSNNKIKDNNNRYSTVYHKNICSNNKKKEFINYTSPYGRYFTIYKSTEGN
jgi:hypothetical protein